MNPEIVFYIGVGLAIIWHIVYLSIVIRYHENIYVAFERSKLCKSAQMEEETVRFASLKSFTRDRKYYITLALILSSIISACILGVIIYMFKTTTNEEEHIDIWKLWSGICAIMIAWIDTILISMAFNDITQTNDVYKKHMNNIAFALESIHKDYPMYQSTSDNPYPTEVEELYTLILRRWVNKNNEATMEDGKSSLIDLTENKRFDIIFGYLKFDITYKDHLLVKTAYDKYCEKHKNDNGFKCNRGVSESMNTLQTYIPTDEYKNYKNRLKSYIIYGLILLAFFVFPVFHMLYKVLGAGLLGVTSIVTIMIASSLGYYQYINKKE